MGRLMIVYHLSALVSVLSGTDVFGAIDIVFIRKTQYCKCAVLDRIDPRRWVVKNIIVTSILITCKYL